METLKKVLDAATGIVDDLDSIEKSIGSIKAKIKKLADELGLNDEVKEEKAAKPEPKEDKIFTELRGLCSTKSKDGHTAEVRAILEKHGANRLSEIKAEEYEEVLKEVQAL